jgi:hypothetical protein
MNEPEWKKLTLDGKINHLHELLHELIRRVDDIDAKVSRAQQATEHDKINPARSAPRRG